MPPEVYNKNFIKQTIFRIDYPLILKLAEESPASLQESISEIFPNVEVLEHLMKFNLNGGEDKDIGGVNKVWRFKSRDDSKILEVSSEYLVIVEKNYTNFTDFSNLVNQVIEAFSENYSFQYIKRIGLRYVNEISIEGAESTAEGLRPYLNESLLSHLNFIEEEDLIRTQNIFELESNENRRTKVRYGLINENYPNLLQDSKFTIDIDCYNSSSIEEAGLSAETVALNALATEYFEKSIHDGLRTVLRNND
tara:strand:- start:169826 stop:170578 length:753 start_codon:yes stop_codon:yes gene_type:complete